MAQPIIPLEIWAADDVILDNTHEANKERPINDLWSKGYDLGQKPGCEEHNYLFNMMTQWISYITGEQIPGLNTRFLSKANNLSDVANVVTARTNLGVWSKDESDARYVRKTGDTMTGALTLPRINFPASSTDTAWIAVQTPSADLTYLDFGLSDNYGPPGGGAVDIMRWRFAPSGGSEFSMMELNASNINSGYLRIFGDLYVRGAINTTNLTATNLTVNSSFIVNSNSAVIGGRNIVRAVNNYLADAGGNINLPLPQQGILDLRLGSQYVKRVSKDNAIVADGGGVMVGYGFEGNNPEGDYLYMRPIQKYVDGNWVTIGQV